MHFQFKVFGCGRGKMMEKNQYFKGTIATASIIKSLKGVSMMCGSACKYLEDLSLSRTESAL